MHGAYRLLYPPRWYRYNRCDIRSINRWENFLTITTLVCGSLGGSLIPRLHLTTLQTLAPNESLPRRLWLQTNLYRADSGSKRISSTQTQASNKSLPCRLWLQTNLYRADTGSKQISTAQTQAPNESLPRRLRLQTNLSRADSGSKQISTAQTLAPNKSLSADSGSKRISTNVCIYVYFIF